MEKQDLYSFGFFFFFFFCQFQILAWFWEQPVSIREESLANENQVAHLNPLQDNLLPNSCKLYTVVLSHVDELLQTMISRSIFLFINLFGTTFAFSGRVLGRRRTSTLAINQHFSCILEGTPSVQMLLINLERDSFSGLLLETACAYWNIKGAEKFCSEGRCFALWTWTVPFKAIHSFTFLYVFKCSY